VPIFRYSWHFPELLKIVSDNYMYAALVTLIKRRETLTAESLPMLERVVMDADKAKAVLDASRHSMGMDISVRLLTPPSPPSPRDKGCWMYSAGRRPALACIFL
jgi:hypothetical protein